MTESTNASAAPAPAPPPVPSALVDAGWLERRLAGAASPVAVYREALEEAARRLVERFRAGVPAAVLVHARAAAVDVVLRRAWADHAGGLAETCALVAVGGYGRGELHPGSDVDVLVLLPDRLAEALDAGRRDRAPRSGGDEGPLSDLERFVTLMWDIGLEVGHSVRTVSQCVAEATADVTVATSLMEARRLAGDAALFRAMREATSPGRIWPSAAFFEAKRQEQARRHARHHGTGYNLEPNVKEGPGGLRDIQVIGWVVKRHYDAGTLEELLNHGFLTPSEHQSLVQGQSFLWQVRMALHVAAGRREDRLLFDYQREIARQFSYEDVQHNLGVEQFMRQYYRTIKELSRLNEMLLELFQEELSRTGVPPTIEPLNRRFQVRNGYLEVTHEEVFRRYPFALLELFLLLQQNPQVAGVRASTIRLVRDHRYLIDDTFRADLGCRSLFLEIIRQPRGQTHEFRRMHTYGILEAYLPALGRIVGLMQFDLFHAYTVDEHILFTVRNLRQFMVPEHYHELPYCSEIVPRLPKPEILYLAGLFHDIAKGRGGDHSELGAEEAIAFCRQHGIGQYDAQLVAWLVRHHLVMSMTAQRQDISDPAVVKRFAALVGDTKRLDYLYLLTVADIRATNPDLWNSWKDSLLRDLHQSTRRLLRRGLENSPGTSELARECREEALARLLADGFSTSAVSDLWEYQGEEYFLRTRPEDVHWQTSEILRHGEGELPLVLVRTGERGTEIFVYCEDRDFLFAATATVLERLGLTVLDARIFTDARHMTYDSYYVLEANGTPVSPEREVEIRRTLTRRLKDPERAIYPTRRVPRRQLRSFSIPSRVHFERDETRDRTLVEVVSADRPGLLSRVGWALARANVSLQSAKVATFGERAEDVFYVTNAAHRALSEAECELLRENVLRALGPKKRATRAAGEPAEPAEASAPAGAGALPGEDEPWC